MRISDWSSDVCSSDLAASQLRPVAGRVPAAGGDGRAAGLSAPARAADRGCGGRHPAHAEGAAPDEPAARQCSERHHRSDGDGDHRSEEHTSELQSLMRISYAVFCLKKKNEKKDNNK